MLVGVCIELEDIVVGAAVGWAEIIIFGLSLALLGDVGVEICLKGRVLFQVEFGLTLENMC